MSELLRNPLIMTVKEFRRLNGTSVAHLTDEQITQIISGLDLAAQWFIDEMKNEVTPMQQNL